MSTAVASVAAPLAPPQSEPGSSPQSTYPTLAPSNHTPAQVERRSASATSRTTSPNAPIVLSEGAAKPKVTPDGKRSPNSEEGTTFIARGAGYLEAQAAKARPVLEYVPEPRGHVIKAISTVDSKRKWSSHGFPPPPSSHPPPSSRARDYRSAEEAVAEMAGGREDLLPKIVHYSSHHPPTPPSPPSNASAAPPKHFPIQANGDPTRSASSRRRGRAEYERDMGTPPLGSGPDPRRERGPFGLGIDSPETQRKKKDEFLGLCARAWDLFHS
ncbi:hypothetical protein P7C71_g985, partial [Lecanoromycetidae sp. Uapishka_2]